MYRSGNIIDAWRCAMRLKEIRLKKGYTQKNVADYLQVSVNVYSRYELEKRQPSIDSLMKMADFFDVSIDYMLGVSDYPFRTVHRDGLSDYETELLIAAQESDRRAKDDALTILRSHRTEKETETEYDKE